MHPIFPGPSATPVESVISKAFDKLRTELRGLVKAILKGIEINGYTPRMKAHRTEASLFTDVKAAIPSL
jgi:hypothetical protein